MVTFNDSIICSDTDYVEINVLKAIAAVTSDDAAICAGTEIQLSVIPEIYPPNGELNFVWTDVGGNIVGTDSIITVSPLTDAGYTVNVTSGLCFLEEPLTVQVFVTGSAFVDAGEDQIVESGTSVDLTAFSPDITIYTWTDEQGNFIDNTQTINTGPINETSLYFVEVGNGDCLARDSVTILILEGCDNDLAEVPNVFSPNNDGVNDYLKVVPGLGIAEISTFKIFNRWGEIVFEADAVSTVWDGTQNGKELDPGVFVYYMELVCVNGETSIKKGNITLLK